MKQTIGTKTLNNYGSTRNFIDLPFKNYEFKKVFNLNSLISYFYFKILKKSLPYFEFKFIHTGLKKNILFYHFFNVVSTGKKPWIVSFESYVPYWTPGINYKNELNVLTNSSCKKIIPISRYAKDILVSNIKKYNPKILEIVLDKVEVIHPSQRLAIESYEKKRYNKDKIIFTIVGSFFFNKGGMAILRVFEKLKKEKVSVKLNVVSSLTFNVWNVTDATVEDYNWALNVLNTNPNFITYYSSLPNEKVLSLMCETDIGLLPSLGDTYGYSTLELMSAGCPVITTDLFVFPEINNNERGWVIPITKDSLNNPEIDTKEQKNYALKTIEIELYKIIKDVLNNPEEIQAKGKLAYEYVKENHKIEDRVVKLEKLYDSIGY